VLEAERKTYTDASDCGRGAVQAVFAGQVVPFQPLDDAFHDMTIDAPDQAVALGHRQELPWWHDASVGVGQPQQHLPVTGFAAGVVGRDHRLLVEHQAPLLDGLVETRYPLHLVAAAGNLKKRQQWGSERCRAAD